MPDPLPDLDSFQVAGVLSIVMQGGLSSENLVQTAQHAGHWRGLFPRAEIVLALSGTEMLLAEVGPGGQLSAVELATHFDTRQRRLALDTLLACCNKVILSKGALPLPRIKSDAGANNVNLQIEAARAGLAAASGRYCLRIRTDMIFADRSFLTHYLTHVGLPRGAAACLRQRVLLSDYFTLNPFTLERMPLHFSDWFHFGLLEDVRALWGVRPMPYADAVHYRTHDYAPDTNELEQLFYVRIAVEQHIALECFGPMIPGLRIDYHNDRQSAEIACRVLVDNFVLGDVRAHHLLFEKYDHAKRDREMAVKCITFADWHALALNPGLSCEAFFAGKVAEAGRLLKQRRFDALSARERWWPRRLWRRLRRSRPE